MSIYSAGNIIHTRFLVPVQCLELGKMTVDQMYLENLEEYVFDENKVVSYKWLSKTLSVHVNEAKRMLFAFADHQRNTKDKELNVTYLVAGVKNVNGAKSHQFFVVNEENLEVTKSSLSPVTSCHVYSVQKAKLKDSNALYTADYTTNKVVLAATSSFSSIKNDHIKIRSDAERTVQPVNEPQQEIKTVEADSSSKKSKKPIGIAGMFAKAPVKKESAETKNVEDSNTKPDNSSTQLKSNKSQKNSVMSFFQKQSGKPPASKEDTSTKQTDTKKSSPEKKKQPINNSKKNKKSQSDEEEENVQASSNKKRRRIQQEMWESSSSEEETPMEEPPPPAVPSPEPSPQPSEDEEPIPPTPPVKQSNEPAGKGEKKSTHRVRRRRKVDKTYMDDDGYMVTEKVWESESASEVEEPVKPAVTKPVIQEKKTKPGTKSNTKQSSLMSFFKKK